MCLLIYQYIKIRNIENLTKNYTPKISSLHIIKRVTDEKYEIESFFKYSLLFMNTPATRNRLKYSNILNVF